MIDSYVWIEAHSAREHTVSETTPARSAAGCGIVTKGQVQRHAWEHDGQFHSCHQNLYCLQLLWQRKSAPPARTQGSPDCARAPASRCGRLHTPKLWDRQQQHRGACGLRQAFPLRRRDWLLCTSAAFDGHLRHRLVMTSVGVRSVGCKGPPLTLVCRRRRCRCRLQAPPNPAQPGACFALADRQALHAAAQPRPWLRTAGWGAG